MFVRLDAIKDVLTTHSKMGYLQEPFLGIKSASSSTGFIST